MRWEIERKWERGREGGRERERGGGNEFSISGMKRKQTRKSTPRTIRKYEQLNANGFVKLDETDNIWIT